MFQICMSRICLAVWQKCPRTVRLRQRINIYANFILVFFSNTHVAHVAMVLGHMFIYENLCNTNAHQTPKASNVAEEWFWRRSQSPTLLMMVRVFCMILGARVVFAKCSSLPILVKSSHIIPYTYIWRYQRQSGYRITLYSATLQMVRRSSGQLATFCAAHGSKWITRTMCSIPIYSRQCAWCWIHISAP